MSSSSQNDHSPPASQPVLNTQKFVWPILAILLLGAVLIVLVRDKISAVLRQADWRAIPSALVFTSLSYLCVSYTYALVARMWGIRMPKRDLTEIGFVTTSLNHVVRSGGVAGYSVRYLLMHKHGVPFNEVMASSLVHYYLTSLDMLMILPVALAYVLFNTDVPQGIALLLGLMTFIFMVGAVGYTLLVFSTDLRTRLIQFTSRIGKSILHRDLSSLLDDFNTHMTYGVKVLRQQTTRTGVVLLLTFADWCSSVIVLSLCFRAFGPPLQPGAVMASFMIGIMAGVISALPGGTGVQEGSITGISMLLGATFEQGILAALLFRVVYYFVPYAISPLFYWRQLYHPRSDYAS
jgi:glycosyltransferase 2 family protein